jgi:hypothetical protein
LLQLSNDVVMYKRGSLTVDRSEYMEWVVTLIRDLKMWAPPYTKYDLAVRDLVLAALDEPKD